MAKNNNKNKAYRVYSVIIDEVWGVEWKAIRYFDTKEEAISFKEKPRQNAPAFGAKYVVVHVSKVDAFNEKMNVKLQEWKAYQERLTKKARKMTATETPNRGGVRYNTRCSAHGFITGATRLA
jgi:hypothetical protein